MTDYVTPRSKLDHIKRRIAVKTGMANTPNLSSIDRVLIAAQEIDAEDAHEKQHFYKLSDLDKVVADPAATVYKVMVMDGDNEVGEIAVITEDGSDPVGLAAVAMSGLDARVGDVRVTQSDIAEWWA